jgi:hypothetical protein
LAGAAWGVVRKNAAMMSNPPPKNAKPSPAAFRGFKDGHSEQEWYLALSRQILGPLS